MAYRCEQAIIRGARDAIRCKVSGTVCAHQKMCLMEGRIVLTDGAMRCPARDGRMPEEVPSPAAQEGMKEPAQGDTVKTEKKTGSTAKKTGTAKAAAGTKTAAKARKGAKG